MDEVTKAYDGDIQMIEGSHLRVHHSAATLRKTPRSMYGSLARRADHKNHAVTNKNGLPIRLSITEGQVHDVTAAGDLLEI